MFLILTSGGLVDKLLLLLDDVLIERDTHFAVTD